MWLASIGHIEFVLLMLGDRGLEVLHLEAPFKVFLIHIKHKNFFPVYNCITEMLFVHGFRRAAPLVSVNSN